MVTLVSIAWYKILPARFGGQKGIACLNQYLSGHYPLICVCSSDNEPGAGLPYKIIPVLPVSKWQFIFPSCWKKIKQTAQDEKATHIILEHPYHGIAAIKACKSTGAKLVVHSHNIESQRFKLLGRWWWPILEQYEKWVLRNADLNLFKTEEDKQWARSHFGLAAEKCMIIPYGIVDRKEHDRTNANQNIRNRHGLLHGEKIILFAGTLDYAPNAKAVEDIYTRIAPGLSASKLNFRIIICGRNKRQKFSHLGSYQHPGVIMAGEVEDIDEYFAAADVFINPVRKSTGVQTKNIDALAHHCNIVCFKKMVDQKTLELAGNKVFVCEDGDWEHFVQQTGKAVLLKTTTPLRFFEEYSWEKITVSLAERIRIS